ncbi:MAG: guanitoxin biosynthesis heme-dependent pre-guanitoxin N-hydroxylase GntA [Luteimonas sp.]
MTSLPDPMQALRDFIQQDAFPCVGAKAALAQGGITVVQAGDLRSDVCDAHLTARLQAFAARTTHESTFLSLAVVFGQTPLLQETEFETALWQRLQAFHDIDAQLHRWDPDVSSHPGSADFSMSVGGRAFYVIGLHPGASRAARRFARASLVFNLHSQFERLKEDGRYQKMQAAISERDIALCGSRNPMLAAHGITSEAPQYSGRVVEKQWACSFHAH